jgi:ABC-type cobalamin/Fe3+-siderophores transport system ATPase subunit
MQDRVPDMTVPRHVVELKIDGYKRIKAANLHPSSSGLVPVRGRNGAGKTSVLDAMLEAFNALKAEVPINADEHASEIQVHLGEDLIVTKKFTRDSAGNAKGALVIEAVDGHRFKRPAEIMRQLVGHFADPVAFLEMRPADQVRTVLEVTGLATELEALEGQEQKHCETRLELGRAARSARAAADSLAESFKALEQPATPPREMAELLAELEVLEDQAKLRNDLAADIKELMALGKNSKQRIDDLQAELEAEAAKRQKLLDDYQAAREKWAAIPEVPTDAIKEQIATHEKAMKFKSASENLVKSQAEAERQESAHQEAEQQIASVREEIAGLLHNAEFPVDGMSYDSEKKQLLVDGVPFSQASQAQRLKAAARVAMSGNPSIRVLFAREGSLLDRESMQFLAEAAEASNFQLWIEVVDSDNAGIGIWVEDGVATDSGVEA